MSILPINRGVPITDARMPSCSREHGPEESKAVRWRHRSRWLTPRSVLPTPAVLFIAALALILSSAVAVISAAAAAAAGWCPDGEVAVEPLLERLPQLRKCQVHR